MATTEHSDLEQQIIKTAQQLFIEKGFVETSMSDIAATVGINRPTLHYYFRTKDKMFKAVFGSIVMSLMPKIQDIVKQDIPFMERLSMIIHSNRDPSLPPDNTWYLPPARSSLYWHYPSRHPSYRVA